MLKTAHKNVPLKKLTEKTPSKGSSLIAVGKSNNIDLYAISWRDRKLHTFVSSCGTTLPGTPARKRRYDECGTVRFKEIPRPKIAETYFDGAPSIDIHNHIRQSGLALEQVWKTHKWAHRIFASLLGVIETNAFLAFNYFMQPENEKLDHNTFTTNLSLQYINKSHGRQMMQEIDQNRFVQDHMLEALSKDDSCQRVQRKCIFCSRVQKRQQKASYYCKLCGKR